jgi:hypothetical protein
MEQSLLKNTKKYKILTPRGLKPFAGILKTENLSGLIISLTRGETIKCSKKHMIKNSIGEYIKASDLKVGNVIEGGATIIKIIDDKETKLYYDPMEVEDGNEYISGSVTHHNCEFLAADTNAVISADSLQKIQVKNPIAKQFDDKFRVFEPPIPGYKYALCCDCGTGVGQDDSTVQVLHINPPKGKPFRQVAVYQCNTIDLTAFPYVIDKIHKQYNKGIILIENNAEAFSVVKDLVYECENEEVFNDGEEKGSLGGIKTTPKVKKKGVSAMKEMIEKGGIELVDPNTVNQLGVFVHKGAKYSAKSGFHDDLVTPLITFGYFASSDLGKDILDTDVLKEIHTAQIRDIREDFITPILMSSDGDDGDSVGMGFDWDKE